jgi:ABC-2 type transport system ATP-binding protein
MSIEVRNLLKQYGTQKAVDNISFKLNKGEIVGFLGPNGAGKSTTMKILTGYIEQTAGEAYVCGLNVAADPFQVKRKIGYLPEANPLYYDMYVKEYLGFIAALHEVKDRKKAVNNVIELVGLTPESNKKLGQLSKGYKQRTGLAAALIHEPEVLILDEPTSGLDPNQIIEIREVIRQQGKDKTVLFSSHILQEVEAICDRVIIIHKGELVADDKLSNLQNINKNTQVVIVEFAEIIGKDLLEQVTASSITTVSPKRFKLTSSNAELVRKQLLELALKHHLNIVSLQNEGQSLEDIFRSLTIKN